MTWAVVQRLALRRWRRYRAAEKSDMLSGQLAMLQATHRKMHLLRLAAWAQQRVALHVMAAWYGRILDRRCERQEVERLSGLVSKSAMRWLYATLTDTFKRWCARTLWRKGMARKAWKLVARCRRRKSASVFALWQQHTVVEACLRLALTRSQRRMTRRVLYGALRLWARGAEEVRAERYEQERGLQVMRRVVNRLRHQRATAVFEHWLGVVQRVRDAQAREDVLGAGMQDIGGVLKQLEAAQLELQVQLLHATFYQQHMERKRREAECLRGLLRLLDRRLGLAFASWRDHACRQIRSRGIVQRAFAAQLHNTSAWAFASWREHALTQTRTRNTGSKAHRKLIARHVRRAFASWAEAARQRQRAQGICRRAVARLCGLCALDVIAAWHAHARRRRSIRRGHVGMVIERHRLHLSSALRAWRRNAIRRRRDFNLVARALARQGRRGTIRRQKFSKVSPYSAGAGLICSGADF